MALKDLRNPFSFDPLTKQEQRKHGEEEKFQKEVERATKDVIASANDCLTSDLFAKYKANYIKAERGLIELGIRLSIVDPIAYAVAAHTIFDRLNLLKMLGDDVTKDAERKTK